MDSHIHLSDPEYERDLPLTLNYMRHAHVKACCVSVDYFSSKRTIELAKQNNLILPFIGTHPEKFQDNFQKVSDLIKQEINKIVGIGEIGLDKSYPLSEDEFKKQKSVFETQLRYAEKWKKPISIHSRKALDEIFQIIPSYSICGKLLHWFEGNKKQLQKAMDMNFFVSYGPLLVYAKDKQVLLTKTEKTQILVETDGPVKFSRCFGYKPAQISFLQSVIFSGSKALGIKFEEFVTLLEQNSKNYLGI